MSAAGRRPMRLGVPMARRRPVPATAAAGTVRAPEVAGLALHGPVGHGAGGAVWAARDGGGRDVVVSVLSLPEGAAGTAQLRRLAALRHGTHPHLARVRQVLPLDGGRCAVVSDRVPGPTLATVLAARGSLDPPELAALLAAVGSGLGHLHERGVVHGDVSPANVVVSGDGVPVLVDLAGRAAPELGTPGFVPPERDRRGAAGAPGDVWALARLVLAAAGGSAGPRLPVLLAGALDADPSRRPAARDLASRAPEIAAAEPVRLPPAAVLAQARMRDDAAPTRRRPDTRRRARAAARTMPAGAGRAVPARRGRTGGQQVTDGREARRTPQARHAGRRSHISPWPRAGAVLGALGLLIGVVVWSAPGERGGGYGHRPSAPPATAPVTDALADLVARRDRALVQGDTAALAATTVPGGPAAQEDEALLDLLEGSATTLEDLRTEVVAVEHVTPAPGGTALDAVLVQHPHERRVGGATVDVAAQEPRCTRLVLTADSGQWRILRTEPCP
ncbi:protein kinase [Georgenia wutianyii]|uniref:non-specific serine/threonine protein kinase n=2 Tax=Georgenia wutianyii TaxID=2585135 RepID=A0ABX5VLX6_9MICO|nr:protein kinase [Georgenia wutianyii]